MKYIPNRGKISLEKEDSQNRHYTCFVPSNSKTITLCKKLHIIKRQSNKLLLESFVLVWTLEGPTYIIHVTYINKNFAALVCR